ncbi:hypothetical protein Poly21_54650 [Allorhodopirellula heiligendammensis]|uniref:Uncharacterized protein n=1 Tax=Allorhodopirellula heiligendammensis TaxID=2714739 RepID=A0A5C6BEU5_9BACT|nr:hypothetical protein Poly21_54650 [Allorhodopirellula heiligendammensis]
MAEAGRGVASVMVTDSRGDLFKQGATTLARKRSTDNDRIANLMNCPLRIFLPRLVTGSRQEQVAQRRDDPVTLIVVARQAFYHLL